MSRNFHILNHPERVFVRENCIYLEKIDGMWVKKEGKVVIPVDSLQGNQDPYVFNRPWLYGYCKNALLRRDMGEGSGVIFGKYHKNKIDNSLPFLLDTIFITDERYWWVDDNGNSPSAEFNTKHPILKNTKNYMDFITPKVKDNEHPKAKYIFTSRTIEWESDNKYKLNICDNKDYFSCIPLYKGEAGIFKLIDIMPIILKHNPEQFKGFRNDPKKLYEIENSMLKDIFNYVLEASNILVIETEGKGSPEELDMELQYIYYKEIYNETNKNVVNDKCKKVCKLKDDKSNLENSFNSKKFIRE